MKKHLSVLMLIAKSSLYKFAALLLAMSAAETGVFYFLMKRDIGRLLEYGAMDSAEYCLPGLENMVVKSRMVWIFAVVFVLLAAVLCLGFCHFGSRQEYTLRRLSISEKAVFAWQALYNCFCFFILWAVQTMLAYGLCRLYVHLTEEPGQSGQIIFIAFYRSGFLHSLVPLAEGSAWVRNTLMVVGMGVCSAYFPYLQRRGRISAGAVCMLALCICFFKRSMGSFGSDALVCIAALVFAAFPVWGVFFRKDNADETL